MNQLMQCGLYYMNFLLSRKLDRITTLFHFLCFTMFQSEVIDHDFSNF